MRAVDRAQAIKDMTSSEWQRGGGKLDKVKGGQKLTIDREPEFIYDKQGEIVGVDAWVRLFGPGDKEVRIDPHRRIVNPPTVPRSGIVETGEGKDKVRVLNPNPSEAFYEAVWDSVASTPNAKGWRTRGTVTTIYGDPNEGTIGSQDDTGVYENARAGAELSTASNSIFALGIGQSVFDGGINNNYGCSELFVGFDSSSISDTDTVNSITISMFLGNKVLFNDFTAEIRSTDWGASLTTGDWIPGASLSGYTLVASLYSGGVGSTGSYKDFVSEASLLLVPNLKTGFVRLVVNSSRHRLGIAPPLDTDERLFFYTSGVSGTTQDPKMTVTHEVGFIPSTPIFTRRPNRVWRLH